MVFAHRKQQDEAHFGVDQHWANLPDGSKNFLADTDQDVDLHKLIDFWHAQPLHLYERASTLDASVSSWYLSLIYLRLRKFRAARNLVLNGGFLHEAHYTPIIDIVQIANKRVARDVIYLRLLRERLPSFHATIKGAASPDTMNVFLKKVTPWYHQLIMDFGNQVSYHASVAGHQEQAEVGKYVDSLSTEWQKNSRSSNTNSSNYTRIGQEKDEEIISIILQDEDTKEEKKVQIGYSTTLKSLFIDYAEVRDSSLRSLRFSYEGRPLFLSSAKNMTPKQMGMNDHAIITVIDLARRFKKIEFSAAVANSSNNSNSKHSSSQSAKRKKSKAKRKKKAHALPAQIRVTEKTQEELKIEHSKMLTKIHEEAQLQFKKIRQRLNNLSIERSHPKIKPRRSNFSPPLAKTIIDIPQTSGLGGKAGKSIYLVQVGEVQNLYKTRKPCRGGQASTASPQVACIDLHGLTKIEAIDLLNEKLPRWNSIAMLGSYPFVIPVEIICGCGNQILSEEVGKWIKQNDNVSNAPKNCSVQRQNCPYRYVP